MAFLADVNFLVALLHDRHAASASASGWLDDQDELRCVAVCRVAQMGALRILTNPSWLGQDVLAPHRVWEGWDLLRSDARFFEADEPPGLEDEWRALTWHLSRGDQVDTDSYLAAFALAGGYRMLTFDRGFRKYESLDALILKST